jgi:phospholipid/cholesterol/gamma-HCH transport system substrate-binding protein
MRFDLTAILRAAPTTHAEHAEPHGGRIRTAHRAWRSAGVALVLAGTIVMSSCASLQSLPKVSGLDAPTYPVYAVFANVLNLPDQAQVRVGAQVVGQVGSISTKDYQADLTLDIKKSVRLPVGTIAQVRFDDPLGDEYILLQPPSTPSTPSGPSATTADSSRFLAPGAHIPDSSTSTAPSVEDTFGALSLVLNGGGINQLQTIIGQLNDTFNGNQTPIHSFLTTIDDGVSSLAGGRAAIDGALASISNLSGKLNGGAPTIANGIDALAPAVGVLASENRQISGLLTQLSTLGAVGTRIAQESGQNAVNDAHDLLPVVQQLNSVSAQLAPDLKAVASFEAETPKIAPGDYLQVNAIVNVLLPPGGFEPTPLGAEMTDARTATPSGSPPLQGSQAVSGLLTASLS